LADQFSEITPKEVSDSIGSPDSFKTSPRNPYRNCYYDEIHYSNECPLAQYLVDTDRVMAIPQPYHISGENFKYPPQKLAEGHQSGWMYSLGESGTEVYSHSGS
jgi:hypothetical protein